MFEATMALNEQEQILANQFAGTGQEATALATTIKTNLLGAYNRLLIEGRNLFDGFANDGLKGVWEAWRETWTQEGLDRVIDEYVEKDAAATVAMDKENKAKQASLIELAVSGVGSINQLKEAQRLLTQELNDLNPESERYLEVQKQLATIQGTLTDRLKTFNTEISNSTTKTLAAKGSIEQLTGVVSELSKLLNQVNPDRINDLIPKVVEAEKILSDARRRMAETIEQYKLDNIDSLSVEEQVRLHKELLEKQEIETKAQIETTIKDEELLQATIQRLRLETAENSLKQDLRLQKEGSKEFIRIQSELAETQKEIAKTDTLIDFQKYEADLEHYYEITYRKLTGAFELGEELEDRLNLIKINKEISLLEKKKSLAIENNESIFEYENELLRLQSEQVKAQARVNTDYVARLAEINRETLDVPIFDPNNLEASLEAFEDYNRRREIQLQERNIKLLELDREYLEKSNQSTTEIDQQIADAKLNLAVSTNDKLIEENERKNQEIIAQDQRTAQLLASTFEAIGDTLEKILDGTLKTTEERQKALLRLLINTVEAVTIAMATAYALAQPDSVSTFGLTGAARAAAMAGLIKGAFSVVKGVALNEDGGLLQYGQGGTLKEGDIFSGKSHKFGGTKFSLRKGSVREIQEAEAGEAILKKTSTTAWLPLISAINESGGGKRLSGDSDRWKPILNSLKKYEDGGISSLYSTIPQIASPYGGMVAVISPENMKEFAQLVADQQVQSLRPVVARIATEVVEGVLESNRMKERKSNALVGSEV